MENVSRRSVLRGSFGLATAGALARPFIANAAATTVSVWWPQGFIREEDVGFRAMVAEYEKASGNKIDHTLIPFAPLMQKIVGALTIGDVRLKVVKSIVRCAAINVDPETALRDLDVPHTMMRQFGHADCGIYAEVIEGGTIGVGDTIAVEEARPA